MNHSTHGNVTNATLLHLRINQGNRRGRMLILTRNTNQAIIINDDIRVEVLEVNGSQVRIGIDAPRSVDVHRQEVWDRIQAEKLKVVNS